MMRKVILFLLICMGVNVSMHAQYKIKNSDELEGYQSIPQERIYLHINDTFLVSGEYLYYKVYCLETQADTPSDLSKIAYVQLVGSDNKTIFRHKIKLSKGLGQGEFFVPASTPSGSYKLFGYTRWMQNMGQDAFFSADVAIVNPYVALDKSMQLIEKKQTIDSVAIAKTLEVDSPLVEEPEFYQIKIPKGKYTKEELTNILLEGVPDSLWVDSVAHKKVKNEGLLPRSNNENFQIILPKKTFNQRELVNLEVRQVQDPLVKGVFSLSVRKLDSLARPVLPNPVAARSNNKAEMGKTKPGESIFLPELRGELLTGTIVSKEWEVLQPNQKIAISFSKTYPVIKTAVTDANGRFFINVNEEDRNGEVELTILGDNASEKQIVFDELNPINYEHLDFEKLKISSEVTKTILERSIHNQIESAYFHRRNDSILIGNTDHKLLNNLPETFVLSDYQRFPTLKETIVEILDNVWLRKEKGNYKIQIRGTESFFVDSNELPLVFMDGIYVDYINSLLEYDVKKIASIAISRDRYYVGPQVFHGILSVSTTDRNLELSEDAKTQRQILPPPLPQKEYFFQGYGAEVTEAQRKYPDFRYQLFWQPKLEVKEESTHINFYTSDNVGDFEIVIQGYSFDGKPVSLREIIKVK